MPKPKTTFNISFTLTRDNDLREDDETHFDPKCVQDEIISWLSDLDYEFPTGVKVEVT